MKKLLALIAFVAAMFVSSCSKFDDTQIWDKINDHEQRISILEELCQQMNSNISSLQTIVSALQNNDYVTAVTPVTKDGKTIGYTIAFTKSAPITIYYGEDGKDGVNGKDGTDGYTQIIGVNQDSDGIYYWTINGEWLTDEDGNKIKAVGTDGKDGINGEDGKDGKDGVDGITPQLKIENDYWYISYDNGASWTKLGKATGEDGQDGTNGTNGENGKDGDSFFQNVDTSNDEYVIFTLADGTQIQLPTWYAFEQLRTMCNQMNTNISSLQTIVNALQNNDYITACTPLMDEGVQIGYTITFAKSGSIVIYHGKDGQNGENGSNGEDGQNGVDGLTPIISVKTDTDGVTYWTLNGEWLLDENGNKVRVNGKDGVDGINGADGKDAITPQLKIENNYWYISYDSGASWTELGRATGEDGVDGDAFFQSIAQDEDYVYLTLSSGEQIDIPKHHPLSVTFTETEDIRVLADKTYKIGYSITGADDKTVIKALAQDGFRAVVEKTDNATGIIEITTPSTILPTEILVFVTDGKERTIMRSINFVEGVIIVPSKSYTIDYAGGTLEVSLSTNIDYSVEIPEADQSWISVAETRAVMRDETLTFTVAKNEAQSVRYTTVKLVDDLGVVSETILITQKAGIAKSLNVATAGTLENLISSEEKDLVEELTLTGKLNTFDFDFIKTMSNLKLLDISATTNTTLPASCFMNSTISTVLLPLELKSIPNRAFYQSKITSLYIPEGVQTIGDYAFYQCKKVKGDLIIPDATTSVGNYCFQESTFNGILKLSNKLTTIGEYAFSKCVGLTGDLIIPDSVTTLGQYAFNECTGFTGDLVVGNGVTAINNYTFFKCSNLAGKISISTNATTIGVGAFAYCSKLTGNLIIPDKVTTIKYASFWECSGLTGYLVLGKSISSIARHSFTRDGGRRSSSEKYYSYSLPLNFNKVYIKALSVPSIVLGQEDVWSEYYVEVEGSFNINNHIAFDPFRTDLPGKRYGGSFLFNYLYSASKLSYLAVPIGKLSIYKESEWGKIWETIEETDF